MKTSKTSIRLRRIQKIFPQVDTIIDATEPLHVTVTRRDSKGGNKKNPSSCALAKACCRFLHADAAIINIATAYIIKDNVATRYKTPITVSREITSFDRHHDFASGEYHLASVPPADRMEVRRAISSKTGPKLTKGKKPTIHRTIRIRTSERL